MCWKDLLREANKHNKILQVTEFRLQRIRFQRTPDQKEQVSLPPSPPLPA